jgi:hypothetical protein
MIHSVNAGWQRTAHSACERPSTQLRDRYILDVDGGLKGRLLEAVGQISPNVPRRAASPGRQ